MARDILTKGQIAERLNVDVRTITNWMQRGLPSRSRSGRVVFDWSDCWRWFEADIRRQVRRGEGPSPAELEFAAAKLRRERAAAHREEMRASREEGSLVPVALIEETVGEVCDRLKASLVNLPTTYGLVLEQAGLSQTHAEKVLSEIAEDLIASLRGVADELEMEPGEDAVPSV